jgi:tRNA(Ile)-lysidine synthase
MALKELVAPLALTLTVGHFNHRLRGAESDREARFVSELASAWGLRLVTGTLDSQTNESRGRSIEDWCRERRYAFLERTAREIGAAKIALGHHRRDQAETVLLNLIRGCGIEGLKGMLPVRERMYIRPFLEVDPEEIRRFLEDRAIEFMTDSSNQDPRHLRNRVRRELIPRIESSFNPSIVRSLGTLAKIARLENDYIGSQLPAAFRAASGKVGEGQVAFDISAFLSLHEALQNRLIIRAIQTVRGATTGLSCAHVDLVRSLLHGGGHAEVHLPGGAVAARNYDRLSFRAESGPRSLDSRRKSRNAKERTSFSYVPTIPGLLEIPEAGVRLRFEIAEAPKRAAQGTGIVCLDFEKIRFPLVCRSVLEGDRIQPLGMNGRKKVCRLFIDGKIPQEIRTRVPLLVDAHSVIWVCGLCLSERVSISERTRTVLQVEII